MDRRAFLAWEIGAGRGHIVKLAAVAKALKQRGYTNTACLIHLDFANELALHCQSVSACEPLRTHAGEEHRGSTSYGDWLRWHCFDDPLAIRDAVERWRRTLRTERPSVVIADQAPCAVLAARSLSIPAVRMGVPVVMPPARMPHFPSFIAGGARENYSEESMREAVNQAIAGLGIPPLRVFPEVNLADDEIVATVPPFDPYREWRTHDAVPPLVGDWVEPGERQRGEVFVYLSAHDRFEPTILAAIGTLKLPVRAVLAGNPEQSTVAAGWRNAIIETGPLPPPEIVRRARVIVHSGSHGTSCLGLRAGIPQVTFSRLMEHIFDGQQLESLGVGINLRSSHWTVPGIHHAIHRAWDDPEMTERAIAVAGQLSPAFAGDPAEMIADRVATLIN